MAPIEHPQVRSTPARAGRLALALMAGASLAACASVGPRYSPHAESAAKPPTAAAQGGVRKVGKPYQVAGVWYVPREQPDYDEVGMGSWYGDAFHMKATANGETFDMNLPTAAHTTLPLPSIVEVVNLENGRRIQVRVNDRGPFVGNRIIDLSREAARQLGYERQGVAKVRVRYLGPAPLLGRDAGVRYASAPAKTPAPEIVKTGFDPVMEIAAGRPMPAAPVEARPLTAAASIPVTSAPLASIPVESARLPAVAGVTAPPASTLAGRSLLIQAGAFSSEANAQKAVSQLAPAGQAVIEPLQRESGVLYRVLLPAPADELEAYALRDRVAEIGFSDARVVRAF